MWDNLLYVQGTQNWEKKTLVYHCFRFCRRILMRVYICSVYNRHIHMKTSDAFYQLYQRKCFRVQEEAKKKGIIRFGVLVKYAIHSILAFTIHSPVISFTCFLPDSFSWTFSFYAFGFLSFPFSFFFVVVVVVISRFNSILLGL